MEEPFWPLLNPSCKQLMSEKKVDLLSQDEEEVKQLITPAEVAPAEHATHGEAAHTKPEESHSEHGNSHEVVKKNSSDSTYEKLQEEFGKLKTTRKAGAAATTEPAEVVDKKNEMPNLIEDEKVDSKKIQSTISSDKGKTSRDEFSGKFTVQIGSHRSRQEAEKFADGFRIRGYEPIISEVNISGKGMWYRVSLGAFKTIQEAKEFISKEKTLLQDEDYIIARFE